MTSKNTQTTSDSTIITEAKTADDMLDHVYRQLVQLHAAVDERTDNDKQIIPWTERALWDLLQEVGAFRREQKRLAGEASKPART